MLWFGRRASMVVLSLLVVGADYAHTDEATYDLYSRRRVGDVQRVEATLDVGGELSLQNGDRKAKEVPLSVAASLVYDEQLVALDRAQQHARQSVRQYQTAKAAIKLDDGGFAPVLGPERRLICVRAAEGKSTLLSLAGPLSREELDLIDVLGTSLLVDGLLPEAAKKVGQSWKVDEKIVQGLLGIDAVAECDVECVVSDANERTVEVSLAGGVQGAADGVSTDLQVKARYQYDRRWKGISQLILAVTEKRAIGHVGPGLDVVAKLNLKIRPGQASQELQQEAVRAEQIDPEQVAELSQLQHVAAGAGFSLAHDRRWHVTADEQKLVILRLMDRGDFLAQCNISPLVPKPAHRGISLEQYQNDVKHSLGKNFDRVLSAAQWTDAAGQGVYQVVVQGSVDKLPVQWHYYLIMHPSGCRVAVSMSVEASLVERVGTADRQLVAEVRIDEPPAEPQAATLKPEQEFRR